MAERALLARSHLPAFRQWMAARGWQEQPPKGEYEVARFTHAEHAPFLLYARASAKVHVTVPGEGWKLVQLFIRDRHTAQR